MTSREHPSEAPAVETFTEWRVHWKDGEFTVAEVAHESEMADWVVRLDPKASVEIRTVTRTQWRPADLNALAGGPDV